MVLIEKKAAAAAAAAADVTLRCLGVVWNVGLAGNTGDDVIIPGVRKDACTDLDYY